MERIIISFADGLEFEPVRASKTKVFGTFYQAGKKWDGYVEKEKHLRAYDQSVEVLKSKKTGGKYGTSR